MIAITTPRRRVTSAGRCPMADAVRAILSLLMVLMLLTSLGVSTIAHAGEPLGCTDMMVSTAAPEHADCGMVQVPADADKGYPHHHGVCHGHEVAATFDDALNPLLGRRSNQLGMTAIPRLVSVKSGTTIKPPEA